MKSSALATMPRAARILAALLLALVSARGALAGFEGRQQQQQQVELECPDECECHYFRVNYVTDCSESDLAEVPYDELSPNVYVLDANGNAIAELRRFPGAIKLRRLQMAHNRLERVERRTFETLEYLIDLDLSANAIVAVEPDAFEKCLGLLTLELQENPLANVDGPFLVSKSLQYLDIGRCNFTELSMDFFSNLTSLHTLDLSGNPLNELPPGPFDPLTSLEILQLNDCRLTSISDNAFFNLEYLKRLELHGNFLTDVDWAMVLGTLHRLEYLDLRNSKIMNLPEDSFSNSTWLGTLILAENELTDLDVATTLGSNLRNLHMLDFSNCHLKGPLSEDAFANATRLKTLYLSGNPLFASDLQMALEPLSNLEKLFLSNCGLKQLPNSFERLNQLEELDISRNPLNDAFIKILTPLHKLKYLNMGYSNLSHIGSKTFSKMTSMRRLVLSGNDLSSLDAGLFSNLTNLESLEMNNCGLKRATLFQQFSGNVTYPELKELSAAGNPTLETKETPLLPPRLAGIKKLDLSRCNITSLPDNAFKKNENLTHLNLSGNDFNSQPGGLKFLQLLPRLESLDLSDNNLTAMSPHVLVKNARIASLNLVGNPFRCDCHVAEMWDWASMVKGDPSILVGSKTSPDDFGPLRRGASRRPRALACSYDDEQARGPALVAQGRRPFAKPRRRDTGSRERPWAKYVRESGCEPLVRILQAVDTKPRSLPVVVELGPPAWTVAVAGIALIAAAGALAGLLGRLRARRFRVADGGSSAASPAKFQ